MTLCSALDYYLAVNIDEIIKTRHITHLHLTPTLASRLHPNLLPSVQHVLVSGEPSMVKVHQDWAEKGLYQGMSQPRTCRRISKVSGSRIVNVTDRL